MICARLFLTKSSSVHSGLLKKPAANQTSKPPMNRHEDIMVPPVLNGLILCGGKSHRMQEDKSLLKYRGIPHWQYICDLLDPIVDDTWISCRKDQAGQFEDRKRTRLNSSQ